MALNKTYAWYIEGNKIGIVEANSDNDIVSTWNSISTAGKTIRVFASHRATDFNTQLDDDGKTYNLKSRYRDLLADYVIARGYEDPRNQNLKAAGYFLSKVMNGIRDIKKTRNSRSRQGGSHIRPSYF